MPDYATTETGSYLFPRPEYHNNVPFHPVPSSIVVPSLVPGVPPYSNQIYTGSYPIQSTYVNHGNANVGFRQEGKGFRRYVFKAESRIEGINVGENVTYRLAPRDYSSHAQPNLSELVHTDTVFQNVQPSDSQTDLNRNIGPQSIHVPQNQNGHGTLGSTDKELNQAMPGVNMRTYVHDCTVGTSSLRNATNESQTSQTILESQTSGLQSKTVLNLTEPERSGKVMMLEPETFDGTSSAEWAEYFIHLEQIAEWNGWSNVQKAKMLSIKLRGEAQKLLGSLTSDQYNDYDTLKTTLSCRFNSQEREAAYRCEFLNRRCMKNECPGDIGLALRRLSLKAFQSLSYSALETHVVDLFIAGLGAVELHKFVQFQHPKSL